MKATEITISGSQLNLIRAALEAATEHANDAAKDSEDPETVIDYRKLAQANEDLWQWLGELAAAGRYSVSVA